MQSSRNIAHKVYPACNELGSDECINFLPETLRSLLEGESSPDKSCLHWTGSATTSATGTIAGWFGCAAASSFCIASSLIHCTNMVSAAPTKKYTNSNEVMYYPMEQTYQTSNPSLSSCADNADHNIRTLDGMIPFMVWG